ncbi:MAG TPA: protein kinase [Terracidiphilus sp.]|nr:protein kinase [Terracidiphilus sp.]
MPLEQGQRVSDYEVLSLLGAGGMGRVYRVRNIISDRVEAMKILLPDYASEPELAARFMAEIRTLAALDHPNIAQLRTAFQYENQLVMVMEFVEGVTLDNLAKQGPAAVDKIVEYATQVLSALSYAHNHGVTHRDIKPANIMITPHGLAKLMDFGIAKSAGDMQLTRPGTTMGSVYYMSPEQVRGNTVDARSDIYSFGVTLYEMLTGKKPFQADTSFSVLNAQLNEAPTPPLQLNPSLPPALNEIVLKAMAKAPWDRFQSADEMRNAIKTVQQGAQAAAAGVPQAAAAPPPPRFGGATQAFGGTPQQGAFAGTPQGSFAGMPQAAPLAAAPQPASPQPGAPGVSWQPVPAAVPVAARKSHRGLWIGLGAVVALGALVAMAFVLPHVLRTFAGQKAEQAANSQTATDTQATPAPQPAAASVAQATPAPADQQAATSSASAASASTPAAQPAAEQSSPSASKSERRPYAPAAVANRHMSSAPGTRVQPAAQPSVQAASTPAAAPSGPSPQEIQKAQDRLSDLGSRADTARNGVNSIRRQQQAQGLDLRGDILSAQSRLNNDMNQANQALSRNDPATANQYMDRAERELTTLETFLGQ